MTTQTLQLDGLPGARREGFELLAETALDYAGENLLALSATGGWLVSDPLFADEPAASVIVLREVDLAVLDRLAAAGAQFGKHQLRAPLVMTPAYIQSTCDVFPLELLEIQQLHVSVYGEDFFADCAFPRREVRLQCEREFKRILIRLRQGILAAAGREKMLADLETDIGVHLLRTLRGFLWLKDQKEYQAPSSVVDAIEKLADRKLGSVRQAIEATFDHNWSAYESLYRDVEALAGWANEA